MYFFLNLHHIQTTLRKNVKTQILVFFFFFLLYIIQWIHAVNFLLLNGKVG